MESLLSLSFSNITARDAAKISKGLRQIEGLLAHICLSAPPATASADESGAADPPAAGPTCRTLSDLARDPAFCEFSRLQNGFECNVTTHLVTCLERLLSMPASPSNDALLLAALDLLQGMLLLHPPSRALFSRDTHMTLLLDLLAPPLPASVQCASLAALLVAMVDNPPAARALERADGLPVLASLLRDGGGGGGSDGGAATPREVVLAARACLGAYLVPEQTDHHRRGRRAIGGSGSGRSSGRSAGSSAAGGSSGSGGSGRSAAGSTGTMRRRAASLSPTIDEEGYAGAATEVQARQMVRSAREKERLVARYFGDVAGIVREFKAREVLEAAV